ncbi:MAG: hypothetical protein RIR49_559 [Actinomycetota bacterium]
MNVGSDIPPSTCPEPVRRAVMVQYWTDLVYLHWPMTPESVQRRLPVGIEVDTFDGSAWVGLIPFHMDGLGFPMRGLAPLPHVGSFPEVNVRTYVRSGDRRGVFFLSLDIDRWLPALVARGAYRIPYCVGDVRHVRVGDLVSTTVCRRWPRPEPGPATASIAVRIGAAIDEPDDLATFLTARWGLISGPPGSRLGYAPVDHPEWPLRRAEVLELDETLVRAAGLPNPIGEPHAMYSPGVPVRIGAPRRVV